MNRFDKGKYTDDELLFLTVLDEMGLDWEDKPGGISVIQEDGTEIDAGDYLERYGLFNEKVIRTMV